MPGPETLAISIPIIALLIPIVAILVHHQQKMAQIIHGGGMNEQLAREVEALRHEVQQLRAQVSQQAQAPPLPDTARESSLEERLKLS